MIGILKLLNEFTCHPPASRYKRLFCQQAPEMLDFQTTPYSELVTGCCHFIFKETDT
jgi:hypothetical protein